MARKVLVGLVVLLGAAAVSCKKPVKPPRITTTIFPTEGMTCGACERAIQETVGRLDGVQAVKASRTLRQTQVTYDEVRLQPGQIVEAITRLGYRAASPPRAARAAEPSGGR